MTKKKKIIIICISLCVLLLGGILVWVAWPNLAKEEIPAQEMTEDEDESTVENETTDEDATASDVTDSDMTVGQITDELFEYHYTQEEGVEYDSQLEESEEDMSYYEETDISTDSRSLQEKLTSSTSLYGYTEELFTIAFPQGMEVVQGGCKVGKYYYQGFIKKDNSGSIIVKYDTEKKTIEKTSNVLPLSHTNDMTYNSNIGKLVVCHNAPERKVISYVNPDSLTIEKTFTIEYEIFSINYNASTNQYVVGIAHGQTFRILDANFKAVGNAFQPTDRTVGYTTQGCASDDNYIYFVLYKQNVIAVYDWSGEFVTLIELDITSVEPENISVVNDIIYLGCSDFSKAIIYQMTSIE